MPAAEARIPTDRSARYLTQLCRHIGELDAARHGRGRHGPSWHSDGSAPPEAARVEYSDSDGVIDFGWARCALTATANELILSAEADQLGNLERLQAAITNRLEGIGRRDDITVTWQPRRDRPRRAEERD
jgi:hypothetical protein